MRRERERTRLGQVLSEQLHRKKVHGAAVGVDAASQLDELRASAAALQVAQHRRLRRGACERCGASLLGHRPRERCSHWARARARPGRDMGAEWRAPRAAASRRAQHRAPPLQRQCGGGHRDVSRSAGRPPRRSRQRCRGRRAAVRASGRPTPCGAQACRLTGAEVGAAFLFSLPERSEAKTLSGG